MRILAKGWQLAALGGNSVALEWGDPGAGVWVQRLLGCHPCAASSVPVAVYRLHSDPVAGGLTVFGGADCLYRGSDPAGGAHLVMDAMMHVWTRSCRDGLMLHAALMSKQGRGLMIGGASGAGKSSLAAWLIQQGWTYHGDEQMFADAGDLHWEGFVRPLCFKGDWAAMFPALVTRPESMPMVAGQTLVAANVFGQQIQPQEAAEKLVEIASCGRGSEPTARAISSLPSRDRRFSAASQASIRPGIMLFPTFRKGSDFSLRRLPAGQAAIRLAKSILNGGNLIHRGVAQAAGIARSCPGFDMAYGDFDQLAPLLQLLDVSVNKAQP